MNEDPNAKLIRELKDEVLRLKELLRVEGIQIEEGRHSVSMGIVPKQFYCIHTFAYCNESYSLQ